MMRRAPLLLVLFCLTLLAGCSDPPPPISVSEGMVTVLNQTDEDWKGVLIIVNDHFRGFVPELKAEGRANAPLNQFTTGHGQRWLGGTRVLTIDVTAKNASGEDVKLSYGREEKPRR